MALQIMTVIYCLCARSEIVERYRLFYRYKKEKVKQVFQILGSDQSEEDFINTFKRLYPEDWQKIQEVWSYEEKCTPPGKRHPMPHPDVYMKEMYRNHKPR